MKVPVADTHRDLGGIDGFPIGVGNGEIGGAGADPRIDHWDRMGIGLLGLHSGNRQNKSRDKQDETVDAHSYESTPAEAPGKGRKAPDHL